MVTELEIGQLVLVLFLVCKINLSRGKIDDVIRIVLLSRGIAGVSFNFSPCTEVKIPRG